MSNAPLVLVFVLILAIAVLALIGIVEYMPADPAPYKPWGRG